MSLDLDGHPERFEFFQLLRLLEQRAAREGDKRPVGFDGGLEEGLIRFRGDPTLAFAPHAVRSERGRGKQGLRVCFAGILGAVGVLPYHYTELAVERQHLKDEALGDFLDVLQERTIAFFYRAWLKYRLPFAFEHAERWRLDSDGASRAIAALVGLGTGRLRDRPPEGASGWLHFSGHFARPTRTAHGVEGIVSEVVGVRARVQQFVGQWIELAGDERSRLGSRAEPRGRHARLGSELVLGERVWNRTSRICVTVGPLDRPRFRRFQPRRKAFEDLVGLVRSYLGTQTDVEYVWIVAGDEVQPMRLGGEPDDAGRLGWTSWLAADGPEGYDTRLPIWLDKVQGLWEHSAPGRARSGPGASSRDGALEGSRRTSETTRTDSLRTTGETVR